MIKIKAINRGYEINYNDIKYFVKDLNTLDNIPISLDENNNPLQSSIRTNIKNFIDQGEDVGYELTPKGATPDDDLRIVVGGFYKGAIKNHLIMKHNFTIDLESVVKTYEKGMKTKTVYISPFHNKPFHDESTNYVIGDLVEFESECYECITPTTGTFDPTKWTLKEPDVVVEKLAKHTVYNGKKLKIDFTINWYDVSGVVRLTKKARKTLKNGHAVRFLRNARKNRIYYLKGYAIGTPLEGLSEAIYDRYYTNIIHYIDKDNAQQLIEAVNGETDPTYIGLLDTVVGVNEDSTPRTARQAFLEQVQD